MASAIFDFFVVLVPVSLGVLVATAFVANQIYLPMLESGKNIGVSNPDDSSQSEESENEENYEELYEEKYLTDFEELEDRELSDEDLIGMKNNIIIETTPIGNVLMLYNHELEYFKYYSNTKEIPYRFLETIARKYVVTYNCKSLYVVMEDELVPPSERENNNDEEPENNNDVEPENNNDEESENNNDEEPENNNDDEPENNNDEEPENNNDDESENNTIPNGLCENVFATFKSYNKKTTTEIRPDVFIKSNLNTYKYGGKIEDYELIKKQNNSEKVLKLDFAAFKKMMDGEYDENKKSV